MIFVDVRTEIILIFLKTGLAGYISDAQENLSFLWFKREESRNEQAATALLVLITLIFLTHRVLVNMSTCEPGCRVTCTQLVRCLAWDMHQTTLFTMNSS